MADIGSLLRTLAVVAAIAGLSGCAAQYRNHGYAPSDDQLSDVAVGIDTRDTVAETIGPPTGSGVLNDQGYFYVSSRVRHFGPLEPQIVDRQVVAVSFREDGVVENIERFTLEDGRVVPLSRRITDNNVRNSGLLRQLLVNLRNFDPAAIFDEDI